MSQSNQSSKSTSLSVEEKIVDITKLSIPKKLEVWRNRHNQKVYTVLEVECLPSTTDGWSSSVVILSCPEEKENSRVSIREFMQHWEKYNPKLANDSDPQSGEIWQNIHTGYATVILFNKQKISWMQKGKKTTMDMKLFVSNWRRIKTASQWFVGALNF